MRGLQVSAQRLPGAKRAAILAGRLGLAGLFLYAGALKLLDPTAFAQDLSHYRLLPEALSAPLAVGLPVLEVVAGLALLTPTYLRGGAALSALMLLAFSGAMAQAKLRGINLDCGCFGAAAQLQVSWSKVTLDLALAMLGLWLVIAVPSRASVTPPRGPSEGAG
jgi:putative oxidoreductase